MNRIYEENVDRFPDQPQGVFTASFGEMLIQKFYKIKVKKLYLKKTSDLKVYRELSRNFNHQMFLDKCVIPLNKHN